MRFRLLSACSERGVWAATYRRNWYPFAPLLDARSLAGIFFTGRLDLSELAVFMAILFRRLRGRWAAHLWSDSGSIYCDCVLKLRDRRSRLSGAPDRRPPGRTVHVHGSLFRPLVPQCGHPATGDWIALQPHGAPIPAGCAFPHGALRLPARYAPTP